MTTIKLYNTRTRKKEVFAPLDPGNVRMYVCGPTVYDRAHLGNARPVVVFDVLYRLLRHVYGADHVTYVRNFTDVDDKINARAKETGREISEITAETTQWFLDDMAELGALEPTHMPRATQYIGSKQTDGSYNHMIGMIQTLLDKGFAYTVRERSNNPPEEFVIADREALMAEHALFEVEKYSRYGELSGRSLDEMIAGARVEVAPYKRNPMDFVLWKPSSPDLPGWDSPWGRGRPGWHIECSAMAKALLGAVFDIHGGGADLMFPHHENEIAQSCCANDTNQMARYWLHNEMLQVEGKKMSKSLGNFFTVRDLLDGNWSGGWKVPGEVIRFVFLSTHYRKPMDWTAEKAREAKATLQDFWALVSDAVPTEPSSTVIEALSDDINTPLAIAEIHKLASGVRAGTVDPGELFSSLKLLGHFNFRPSIGSIGWGEFSDAEHRAAMSLARRWMKLREERRFDEADHMKKAASDLGVELIVLKESGQQVAQAKLTRHVSPERLEALK